MRIVRRKLLVEPPATAAPDIAFILIVFFLVCASVQPDSGKPQDIPRSEESENKEDQSQNIEITLTQKTILINSETIAMNGVETKLKQLLSGKKNEADHVVMLKSAKDTTYQRWIDLTSRIEKAGGIVTLQLEQEQTIIVN
ncbi:MAG: biopolymer transport protein ExbD [Verrucomicrobiales bacterium]|jgi:biopolymer transport protein ExbD